VSDSYTVLQPNEKVVKLNDRLDTNQRFKVRVSQIKEIRSFLVLNVNYNLNKNKKENDSNGLGRIRTGDLPCQGDVITD
jgi:hypothetical protein